MVVEAGGPGGAGPGGAPVPTTAVLDGPDDLTVGWLDGALSLAGVDASVGDVAVSRVGTGQMGSCYRLEITYARGSGPAKLIAKLPASDPTVRGAGAVTYRTEVGFYRELGPRLAVPAPRCYAAAIDHDGSFTLLLEDAHPAEPGDQIAGCTVEEASQAVVAIAALHAGTWGDDSSAAYDWLFPSGAVMAPALQAALPAMTETFLARHGVGGTAVEVMRRFATRFEEWVTARPEPWSLIHADYRLDNLLFAPPRSGTRPVTPVDWQTVSVGHPMRDVAYLLATGFVPEDRRRHERAVVGRYLEALGAHGVGSYDPGRCWDDYRHSLFHGFLISILGEATSAPTDRGRRMFSAMVERTAAAVHELDALDLLDVG